MKMNFKKTLSLILAVLMVMTAVPLSGMATGTEPCDHANAEIDILSKTADGKFRHYITCSCGLDEKQFCDGPDATSCGEAKKCSICNQVIGAALDHTYAPGDENEHTFKANGADCKTGNTYYETCTECGDISDTRFFTSETNFGPHDWDEGTVTYENCEEEGTCVFECENCDETKTEEVEARDHSFTAKVEDDEYLVDGSVATCEKGAEYYYSCEYCGEKGTEKFRSEVTGNHVFHEMKDVDFLKEKATCSKNAVYYKWCSACTRPANQIEGYEDETFEVPDSAHAKPTSKDDVRRPLTEDERVTIINADCYTDAKYAMHCKECGEPMITEKEDFAKEGLHFYEAEGTALNPGHRDLTKLELVTDRVEPSCTKAGQEAIYKCKEGINCPDANWDKIGGELIPEKGHAYDAAKTLTYKEAECGLAGHYGRKYCKDCDTSFYTDAKGADAGSEKGLKEKSIKALSHVNDLGGDDLCDICGTVVKPSETCKCICHKGGFMYIVAIFLKLFWRLTGTKEYCECSSVEEIVKHY